MSLGEEDDIGPEVPDKLFFRIGEAASLVGVEAHVLRYWESEFKMRTQRSSTGQRMYRRKDIATFMKIRKLLHDDGFTIAGARKALEDGIAPGAPASTGGGDTDRIHEAIERIKGLREQVGTLREQYRAAGVATFRQDG
ncbi:MAG: MerR family transcriptional regulator [Alphaproteobacteria bacterium]|nr:MerR family transcriptional regulator [Alphaproteobacteria bacterium]